MEAFSYPVPMGGILSSLNSNLSSHQLRAQLNYNYGWKDNNISAIIGSELRTKIIRGSSTTAYGYDEETETNSPLMDFTTSYPTYPFGQGRQILIIRVLQKTPTIFFPIMLMLYTIIETSLVLQ